MRTELSQPLDKIVHWVEANPGRALLYGAAAGFGMGFVGLARLFVAYRVISSVPQVKGTVLGVLENISQRQS